MNHIVFKTNDNIIVDVDPKVLQFSNVLNDMITILGDQVDDEDKTPIFLQHISKAQLDKVIEWCLHHREHAPMTEEELHRVENYHGFHEWDKKFLNRMNQETMISVAFAANFLDIKPLLLLVCKATAINIKGKDINGVFGMFRFLRKTDGSREKQIESELDKFQK